MRAHITQNQSGEWASTNCFAAADGFRQMGWEVLPFVTTSELLLHDPAEVVVGSIGQVEAALSTLGCRIPLVDDYPAELISFLGRRMWQSTLDTVANNPAQWPVFVKPIQARKQFAGVLVRRLRDLIGCGNQAVDVAVWCAEPISFVAEWRCFVRYGEIMGVRPYKGDWRVQFAPQVVEAIVAAYSNSPCAYAFDIGVTDAGATLLVEVNEGYSVGSYGLPSLQYAKLLSARWAELTGTADACNF